MVLNCESIHLCVNLILNFLCSLVLFLALLVFILILVFLFLFLCLLFLCFLLFMMLLGFLVELGMLFMGVNFTIFILRMAFNNLSIFSRSLKDEELHIITHNFEFKLFNINSRLSMEFNFSLVVTKLREN